MFLRRLTQHIKEQNWLAVILDFVIVVIGVGVALAAQQWLNDGEQRKSFTKAQHMITIDIASNLYNALENVAFAECRKEQTHKLTQLLLESNENWTGVPQLVAKQEQSFFEPVIQTSLRVWGSSVWDMELQRGSLDNMDNDRRYNIAASFQTATLIGEYNYKTFELESELAVLSLSMPLSSSQRTKFLLLLAKHDGISRILEVASSQLIEDIEDIGGIDSTHPIFADTSLWVRELNEAGAAHLGSCFVPIKSDYLDI